MDNLENCSHNFEILLDDLDYYGINKFGQYKYLTKDEQKNKYLKCGKSRCNMFKVNE